jgi:hypothetical protein
MHANMLTVEAAVEETFGVRSARLKELATPEYQSLTQYARGSATALSHATLFSQTGPPYSQHAAARGSRALRHQRRIIPQTSIMAPSLTKLVGSQHAPICVVSSSVSTRRATR